MEIICDTNIWYGLGSETIDISIVKKNDTLVITYLTIEELAHSLKILNKIERAQNIIRSACKLAFVIPEPPFSYLKKISNNDFDFKINKYNEDFLKFTEKIAKGYRIEKDKIDDFRVFIENKKENLHLITKFVNDYAKTEIKPNIKNSDAHKQEDSIPLNRSLINNFVVLQTNSDGLGDTFDWKQIELF